MNIGEKITLLRKQKGLSQEALAEHLNVSRQAVSRWEMGTTLPDATNILLLSKLMALLPMLFIFRIAYMMFPSTSLYPGDTSMILSSGFIYTIVFLIYSTPAALTIRYIHKKRETLN